MAVEDLTTYTETDPNSYLTVTSTKIDVNVTDGDFFEYTFNVYKDFTADYFNALDIDWESWIGSGSSNNVRDCISIVNSSTPATEHFGSLATTDVNCQTYYYDAAVRIYLFRGVVANDNVTGLSNNTTYYNTVSRVADSDTITLKIYSDSGRTTLVDTLSVSGFGTSTKWQYLYGYMGQYAPGEPTTDADCYIQNVEVTVAAATNAVKSINGLSNVS